MRNKDLIEGVLPATGYGYLCGPDSCGKSNLVYELIHAVVTGESWRGRASRPGRVLLFTDHGMSKSLKDVRGQSMSESNPLAIYMNDCRLLEAPTAFANFLQSEGPFHLIVIEGLDVNGAEDARRLQACAGVARNTGSTVLSVHTRSSKTFAWEREWRKFRRGAEFAIEITRSRRPCSLAVLVRHGCSKQEFKFKPRNMLVGYSANDQAMTACVGGVA